jgi:hypothetical protein
MPGYYLKCQCDSCSAHAICRLTTIAVMRQMLCVTCFDTHLTACGLSPETRMESANEFHQAALMLSMAEGKPPLDLGIGPPRTTPRRPEDQAPEIPPSSQSIYGGKLPTSRIDLGNNQYTQIAAPMLQMDPDPDQPYDEAKLKSWLEREMSDKNW